MAEATVLKVVKTGKEVQFHSKCGEDNSGILSCRHDSVLQAYVLSAGTNNILKTEANYVSKPFLQSVPRPAA
jgi:hypothetical protein